jgi:hypothetical protein
MYKNIVLLFCDSCFDYQPIAGARHEQLMQWYYDMYGALKDFRLTSGFYSKADGSLEFNSWSHNGLGLYTNNINQMNLCEQDVLRKVINGQLNSYTASWKDVTQTTHECFALCFCTLFVVELSKIIWPLFFSSWIRSSSECKSKWWPKWGALEDIRISPLGSFLSAVDWTKTRDASNSSWWKLIYELYNSIHRRWSLRSWVTCTGSAH